jgi:hypothetical protein
MGHIREPKNFDLLVGPSVFTEASKRTIANAIALYKKTGQKLKASDVQSEQLSKKSIKI